LKGRLCKKTSLLACNNTEKIFFNFDASRTAKIEQHGPRNCDIVVRGDASVLALSGLGHSYPPVQTSILLPTSKYVQLSDIQKRF